MRTPAEKTDPLAADPRNDLEAFSARRIQAVSDALKSVNISHAAEQQILKWEIEYATNSRRAFETKSDLDEWRRWMAENRRRRVELYKKQEDLIGADNFQKYYDKRAERDSELEALAGARARAMGRGSEL